MNIVICGSLKNVNKIELLGKCIKQAIPAAEVIVPAKDLDMFQAYKEDDTFIPEVFYNENL